MILNQRAIMSRAMHLNASIIPLLLTLSMQTAFSAQSHGHGSLPDFEATNLRFFESGVDLPPYGAREYATHFSQSLTRHVAHELHLRHPHLDRGHDFAIETSYIRPDGSTLGTTLYKTRVEASWDTSAHAVGWGWEEPGKWPIGKYTVKVFIGKREVAAGFFWIDADKSKPDGTFETVPEESVNKKLPDDLGEL